MDNQVANFGLSAKASVCETTFVTNKVERVLMKNYSTGQVRFDKMYMLKRWLLTRDFWLSVGQLHYLRLSGAYSGCPRQTNRQCIEHWCTCKKRVGIFPLSFWIFSQNNLETWPHAFLFLFITSLSLIVSQTHTENSLKKQNACLSTGGVASEILFYFQCMVSEDSTKCHKVHPPYV